MDTPHVKEPRMAGGTWKVAEQHVTDKYSSELTGFNKEIGEQQHNEKTVDYLKEATVVLDLMGNKDIRVEDIIKATLEKVGFGNLLAVRPKKDMEYELTLRSVDACDGLLNGLEINGQFCEVRSLERSEYIVSFLHLPAYVNDKTIEDKLKSWAVTPMTKVRRRLYPGTNIADGTRYVKVLFPKEIKSLPYSTKFETSDGVQYFRVIHDGQVRLCRMCFQPGHFFKDCPNFTCFECCEQGHFARNCKAEKCPDCKKVFVKCDCATESEGVNGVKEIGTENVGESLFETDQEMSKQEKGFEPKDLKTGNGKETEKREAAVDGVEKKRKRKSKRKVIMETELNEEAKNDTDQTRLKDQEKESLGNVHEHNAEIVMETTEGDRGTSNENQVNRKQTKQKYAQVLRYKEIPNLNLVLRKQKLRRAALKKKKKTFKVT